MTLYTSGFGSAIGWPIMAHGLDHTITGLRSLCSGQHSTSATQQLLEKTGMSPNMAANTDALLGFTGSTYGSHIVNSALRSALPSFRLPTSNLTQPFSEKSIQSFKYHERIRIRAVQDPVAHNFPYSFDEIILKVNPIKQKNGTLLFNAMCEFFLMKVCC
jgi:hypothetical protein